MTMQQAKRKKLESRGWKTGSVKEFLNLSPEEVAHLSTGLTSGEGKTLKQLIEAWKNEET